MKALPWQGSTNVEVLDVPDPAIEEATDVIITVTSTAVCGSDLHLYGVLGAYLKRGDILGREAVGDVAEVGPGVEGLDVGDRVVIPFNISCRSLHRRLPSLTRDVPVTLLRPASGPDCSATTTAPLHSGAERRFRSR
jgi:threonine dehydrogenase-like Zn-dependent dehydrogenase